MVSVESAGQTNAAVATLTGTVTPPSASSSSATPAPAATDKPEFSAEVTSLVDSGGALLAALVALATVGGCLLYQCGLTRAKNCGHTSTLLLVGSLFGLAAYWIGGFAVQTGGIGDAHAALSTLAPPATGESLDHELGFTAAGHHWGVMGNSGFFLVTGHPAAGPIATLFLVQAAALLIAVTAALGSALERSKLVPIACFAFLIGALIYPLTANWIWGGGWLAQSGREFGVGHGMVDVGGAGVVHETAGVLALALAVILGPRHGRFRRNGPAAIPGHNVPFYVLGTIILLVAWTAANAYGGSVLVLAPSLGTPPAGPISDPALASINTLLAATAGLVISFFDSFRQRQRPEPARLCRGLLGGAVAISGCAGLVDPWAAFVIGAVAALIVQAAMAGLERKRIDDPVGAAAVHGAAGLWGVLAVGLFANGTAGLGVNGVNGSVRGLFFGGGWHQLAAQALGGVTIFVVVYLLGSACLTIVQKIVGLRVDLAQELNGLDWPEVGALGYQGDVEEPRE